MIHIHTAATVQYYYSTYLLSAALMQGAALIRNNTCTVAVISLVTIVLLHFAVIMLQWEELTLSHYCTNIILILW